MATGSNKRMKPNVERSPRRADGLPADQAQRTGMSNMNTTIASLASQLAALTTVVAGKADASALAGLATSADLSALSAAITSALAGKASTAHQATHGPGGSDALKLDDLAVPDDNTDLNASTTKHGLMAKFPNTPATQLRGDGTFYQPQASNLFPGNPLGTTSSTDVMMGLAASFTPNKSGRVLIAATFNVAISLLNATATATLKNGTGTAPAFGVAGTGTQVGGSKTFIAPLGGAMTELVILSIVSGLTPATAYWFDLALRTSLGTAQVSSISLHFLEI